MQDALSSQKVHRTLRLVSASFRLDDENDVTIIKAELHRALTNANITASGDDGITYLVLSHLQQVPDDPLLRLYNLCLQQGHVPQAWATSLIVPIPKPGTDKFRPISLTSCFSKVMERIILTRLLFRLQDKLSSRLFGFFTTKEYAPLFVGVVHPLVTNQSCSLC